MPWCPVCKKEYPEGTTVCSDCIVDLVSELQEDGAYVPFFQAEKRNIAEKLMNYFEYSGLKSRIQYDEEAEAYILSVPCAQEKQAKKLYQAFYFVERDRIEKGPMEEPDQPNDMLPEFEHPDSDLQTVSSDTDVIQTPDPDVLLSEQEDPAENSKDEPEQEPVDEEAADDTAPSESSGAYVMKSEKYKDYSATVVIFLFLGFLGIAIVILNLAGILTFLNGLFPNLIMGAIFIYFVYVALSTYQKAKKLRLEIEDENKLTQDINLWLKETVTDDFLASLQNDSISVEANYIKTTETIRDMLMEKFGKQDPAYLDRLIEEFYSTNYDPE